MMVEIYTSANNGEEILTFPLPPKDLPDIVHTFKHEAFETNDKELTLIGNEGRKTLNIQVLLPCNKKYRFINGSAPEDGRAFVDFWEKWCKRKVPMRLVITDDCDEILNIGYTINSFKWHYDKKKDIVAELDIAEYVFPFVVKSEEDGIVERDITITYKGAVMGISGLNSDGRWLVGVRAFLKLLGRDCMWSAKDKSIYFGDSVAGFVKLKSEFEIKDGTSYSFVYMLANELFLNAAWDGDTQTITLTDKTESDYVWSEVKVVYDDSPLKIKAANVGGYNLVGVRDFLTLCGFSPVTWDSDSKTISYTDGNAVKELLCNYVIYNDVAYAYIYRLCDCLNLNSNWDGENVLITK